jgi:WW domain
MGQPRPSSSSSNTVLNASAVTVLTTHSPQSSGFTQRSSGVNSDRLPPANSPSDALIAGAAIGATTHSASGLPGREVFPLGPPPLAPGWQQYETDDGIPYYVHALTNETVWERPGAEIASVSAGETHDTKWDGSESESDQAKLIQLQLHGATPKDLKEAFCRQYPNCVSNYTYTIHNADGQNWTPDDYVVGTVGEDKQKWYFSGDLDSSVTVPVVPIDMSMPTVQSAREWRMTGPEPSNVLQEDVEKNCFATNSYCYCAASIRIKVDKAGKMSRVRLETPHESEFVWVENKYFAHKPGYGVIQCSNRDVKVSGIGYSHSEGRHRVTEKPFFDEHYTSDCEWFKVCLLVLCKGVCDIFSPDSNICKCANGDTEIFMGTDDTFRLTAKNFWKVNDEFWTDLSKRFGVPQQEMV